MTVNALEEIKLKLTEKLHNFNYSKLEISLKESSYSKTSKLYMTECQSKIINIDELVKQYNKQYKFISKPSSVDSIYKFIKIKNELYLIEFKSGSFKQKEDKNNLENNDDNFNIKKHEIYKKGYDTFITLMDLGIINNLDYCKNNVIYILVYNENKKEEHENQNNIFNDMKELSKSDYKNKSFQNMGGLERFLFKESYACTKDDFNNFIVKEFEQEESI
ncbi:hypothetical protein R4K89_12790 [Brachyspira intermedia]|uniref:hypothetical protein n=1 Tax=Brachyspira intermedia TaxID=84377 RepID=UPI0030065BA3